MTEHPHPGRAPDPNPDADADADAAPDVARDAAGHDAPAEGKAATGQSAAPRDVLAANDAPVPRVTSAFLVLAAAASIAAFARYGATPPTRDLASVAGTLGAVAGTDWHRLVVANLLHVHPPHLLLNLLIGFLVGRQLEHVAGRPIAAAVILVSMVTSSVGAFLIDNALVSVGASGVVFGLLGAGVAIDPASRTPLGLVAVQLLVANAILTFVIPGISIGGHLGGAVGGALVGLACWRRERASTTPNGDVTSATGAGRVRPVTAWAVAIGAAAAVGVLVLGGPTAGGATARLRGELSAWKLERITTVDDVSCTPARDGARTDPARVECVIGDGDPETVTITDDGLVE